LNFNLRRFNLDAYESMPIEEFGAAMMRGMGWEEGKPVGRNSTGLVGSDR
jgi:G patch domain/KOW motif-containing protein